MFDLSETNIKMSKELANDYPNIRLKSAVMCDACSIPRQDKSADAILLMAPLYSITEYEERILTIKESLSPIERRRSIIFYDSDTV